MIFNRDCLLGEVLTGLLLEEIVTGIEDIVCIVSPSYFVTLAAE